MSLKTLRHHLSSLLLPSTAQRLLLFEAIPVLVPSECLLSPWTCGSPAHGHCFCRLLHHPGLYCTHATKPTTAICATSPVPGKLDIRVAIDADDTKCGGSGPLDLELTLK